jgi:hypothetical protein
MIGSAKKEMILPIVTNSEPSHGSRCRFVTKYHYTAIGILLFLLIVLWFMSIGSTIVSTDHETQHEKLRLAFHFAADEVDDDEQPILLVHPLLAGRLASPASTTI